MVAPAPYPPSALTRLYAAVERLPGGGWWVYPLVFLALVAYHHVALWLTGAKPFGTLSLDGVAGMVYGPYAFASAHLLIRIAASSLAAFRPASGLSDEDYALRRYELVTLPAGRVWIPATIGTIIAIGSLLSAPLGAITPFGGTIRTALIVFGPAGVFGYGMTLIVAYQTLRQLREVDRLHREATAIDPFDRAPIYAFSRLTVIIGVGFVFAAYYSLVANADFQAGNVFSIVMIVGVIALGAACFVMPLWGIHGRLVAAKDELVRGVNLRAQALQEELYSRVDTSNLVGVRDVTDALVGVQATGAQIDRLPTWPWPPSVLRGFLSAVLLPVVVFVITQFVGTQLK